MHEQVLIALFGAVVGFFLGLYVDYLREPKVIITLKGAEPNMMGNDEAKVLRLNAVNKPLSPRLQQYISRRPATFCRGDITFHKVNGEPFFSDRVMDIRFPGSRIPANLAIYTTEDAPSGRLWGFIQDEYLRRMPSTIDLIAGYPMGIDVAIRRSDEQNGNCYGFTNESFDSPKQQHPDWCLPPNTYLIRVRLYSQGHLRCVKDFRLLSSSTSLKDFKLESARPNDTKNINKYSDIYSGRN